MPDDAQSPPAVRAFHIGLPETGGAWLAELFKLNGYRARLNQPGGIAQDIIGARLTGRPPLTHWPHAVLFADMEDLPPFPAAPLGACHEYAFLQEHFPKAVFLLPERDLEDWLAALFTREHGLYRRREVLRHGVDEAALLDIWATIWEQHLADVAVHFAGCPQLIRFNLDTDTPKTLSKALSPWFNLPRLPATPPNGAPDQRKTRLAETLATLNAPPQVSRAPADLEFAEQIATFCLGQLDPGSDPLPRARRSRNYANWDGAGRVTGPDDEDLPLVRDHDGPLGRFFATDPKAGLARIQGTLNEMLTVGVRWPVQIDMQDARWQDGRGRRPLVCYNRREKAHNMVLWPLPGYHTPGKPHYVTETAVDNIAFADKADIVVWRGNLTGVSRPDKVGNTGRARAATRIYAARNATVDRTEHARLDAELASIPRATFVIRFAGNPDFDVALTPGVKHDTLRKIDRFAPLIGPSRPPGWFHSFKYVVCIPGNDAGSNFLMAANTNSVVLKEEDRWQHFFSGQFRPWEHYIPLAPGAADIEHKLAWARSHPGVCADIARAAQAVCRKLAGQETRRAFLQLIGEGLRTARD